MPSQHDIATRVITRAILEQLADSSDEAALAALTHAILGQVAESGLEVTLAALACATATVIINSGDTTRALDTFRTYFAAALDEAD